MHQQVLERIKAPLFTSRIALAETSYVVWAHLHLLVKRAPMLFCTDYKSFTFAARFSRESLKLSMLVAVATPTTRTKSSPN